MGEERGESGRVCKSESVMKAGGSGSGKREDDRGGWRSKVGERL